MLLFGFQGDESDGEQLAREAWLPLVAEDTQSCLLEDGLQYGKGPRDAAVRLIHHITLLGNVFLDYDKGLGVTLDGFSASREKGHQILYAIHYYHP
jgi:hypothetical protein